VEIKCQLDATDVFIADLIACSTCFGHHYAHHQELKIVIQWLLPVVFRAVVFKLLVWCGAEGNVSGLHDAVGSCRVRNDNELENLVKEGTFECIKARRIKWWGNLKLRKHEDYCFERYICRNQRITKE